VEGITVTAGVGDRYGGLCKTWSAGVGRLASVTGSRPGVAPRNHRWAVAGTQDWHGSTVRMWAYGMAAVGPARTWGHVGPVRVVLLVGDREIEPCSMG
jgi:hypothetical protein